MPERHEQASGARPAGGRLARKQTAHGEARGLGYERSEFRWGRWRENCPEGISSFCDRAGVLCGE